MSIFYPGVLSVGRPGTVTLARWPASVSNSLSLSFCSFFFGFLPFFHRATAHKSRGRPDASSGRPIRDLDGAPPPAPAPPLMIAIKCGHAGATAMGSSRTSFPFPCRHLFFLFFSISTRSRSGSRASIYRSTVSGSVRLASGCGESRHVVPVIHPR